MNVLEELAVKRILTQIVIAMIGSIFVGIYASSVCLGIGLFFFSVLYISSTP